MLFYILLKTLLKINHLIIFDFGKIPKVKKKCPWPGCMISNLNIHTTTLREKLRTFIPCRKRAQLILFSGLAFSAVFCPLPVLYFLNWMPKAVKNFQNFSNSSKWRNHTNFVVVNNWFNFFPSTSTPNTRYAFPEFSRGLEGSIWNLY